MVYLISYDLDHHARPVAYHLVEKMIMDKSLSFRKPLYSQWFVETNDSIDVWQNRMQGVVDPANDFWLIVKVQTPYQGLLNKEIWEWLRTRV
jgi:hypothetical protein